MILKGPSPVSDFDFVLAHISRNPKNSVVVFSLHRVITTPLEWPEYKYGACQVLWAAADRSLKKRSHGDSLDNVLEVPKLWRKSLILGLRNMINGLKHL